MMLTSADILQLIMAFLASLGFALFFNMHRRPMILAALGGLLSWTVFVIGRNVFDGIFLPCLLASAVAAVFAEGVAYRHQAPTSIFFIVAVIPLIPGRYLFNTMQGGVEMNWDAMGQNAIITGEYALAIAIGISVVWTITEVLRSFGFYGGNKRSRSKHPSRIQKD